MAGCGSGGDDGGATALTVREYDGEQLVRTTELACGPDDAVCARVVAVLPRLDPAPGEVCTQIYGGPERIAVSGTAGGDAVDLTITRTNGCEIDRYDLLQGALAG